MSRIKQFIRALSDESAPPIRGQQNGDNLLLHLVAHVFLADSVLATSETALFRRLVPDCADPESKIYELVQVPLDMAALVKRFQNVEERGQLYELAEVAVWGDQRVEHTEVDLLESLMTALGMTE